MSEEESIILGFLQANPESAFGRKEIARKAGHTPLGSFDKALTTLPQTVRL
mgnify:CR=1 FL=1